MAKLTPNKPLLFLLYGFPGSGKTHFAHNLCQHIQAAHVHGDRIRGELFERPRYDKEEDAVVQQLMNYMTGEFLHAGMSVVYDVNAARFKQRLSLRELARKTHTQPILVWFQIDLESSYQRITKRDKRRAENKFAKSVNPEIFKRTVSNMQNPNNEDYIVISGKHTFEAQLSALMKRLRELGLITVNDTQSKVIKPGLINLIPNPTAGRVDMKRRNILIR
jgi:predicted kinase